MTYDVAIIGAGVIGGLTARELAKFNLSICILERGSDVAQGASRANSAIVHAGFDPKPGTEKARLNVAGASMMEQITRELDVPYKKNGSLVLAFSHREMEQIQNLYQRGKENRVPDMEILTGQEATALEPHLSKNVVGALLAKSAAIVCPYELTIAAVGNAMDNGVELITEFKVETIKKAGDEFIVSSVQKQIRCRYIVNAAGLYSDDIAAMVGERSFNIVPKKGEYMLLDKTEGASVTHTIFQVPTDKGKGILVSPTVDHNLILGPTSEVADSKEEKETTTEGLTAVRQGAEKSMDRIRFNRVITSFTGLRASVESGDFILRSAYTEEKMILAAGIDSPGLSASPAIAQEIIRLLKKAGLPMNPNENFHPTRQSAHHFRALTVEEKNRWIKKDPRYGRVVCRCEEITEGEIVAAIHQNPPARTLDAVKIRSRVGMGRCQGGFCSPNVVEILAKEWNIPVEQITKSGRGSNLVVGRTKGGELQ